MKLIILLILIFPILTNAQGIYTVSNVPGISANFKTLQGAHDTVAAGSTIYLIPSSNNYGDVIFSKKLTVYGTGFFLGQNLVPNTQANTASVNVNSIIFKQGSDNSYIEGIQLAFQAQENTQRITFDTVSNITISRCLLVSNNYGAYGGYNNFFLLNGANNCIVKQCYIQDINGYVGNYLTTYSTSYPNFSGILFTNNIIDWSALGGNGFRIGPYGTGGYTSGGSYDISFLNNTFIAALKYALFGNLNFTNNIFINTSPTDVIDPSSVNLNGTNLNNITNVPNLFAVPGNNYQNASINGMFVSGLSGYHSTDQKWMLQDTSFANNYGLGGIACGAFGGANPYKLSGIPNLPFIYSLTVPSQATSPGTIGVHIKANASN